MKLLDDDARKLIEKHPNVAVSWYMMAAYAYYVLATPILSDGYFDELGRFLIANKDKINHRHFHLLDDYLSDESGSCSELAEFYPLIVRSVTERLIRNEGRITGLG